MHIFVQERGMFLPKHPGEAGWVIEHIKLHFSWFWCAEEPPPSIQTDM